MRREPAAWGELAGFLEVRPLSAPLPAPAEVRSSPFSAALSSTLEVLRREVAHLEPRRLILEADFRPQDLRLDGLPRAHARALSEGVVLTLIGTRLGHDLRYPCATFTRWADNLRAIALSLESLRRVDRYGVTVHGEQYRGFAALPRGEDEGSPHRGADLVREHGGLVHALKATHPDHGGEARDFRDVQAYREAMGRANARAS